MDSSLMEIMARIRGAGNISAYNFIDYISKKYFEDNAMGTTTQMALDLLEESDREALLAILADMNI